MSRLVALGFGAVGERPNIDNDHAELIRHLDAGDGAAAAEVARRHVETFRAMTMDRVVAALDAAAADAPLPAAALPTDPSKELSRPWLRR
jgi:DNA-binding GntR family transcriptional regulator